MFLVKTVFVCFWLSGVFLDVTGVLSRGFHLAGLHSAGPVHLGVFVSNGVFL